MDADFRTRDPPYRDLLWAATVFAAAFLVAAWLPAVIALPFLETFVALAALALLVGAALAGRSPRVWVGYRRSVWVAFGALAGWWSLVFWVPDALWVAPVVLTGWVGIAAAESARRPSLGWAVATTSAPAIGWVGWWVQIAGGVEALADLASDPLAVVEAVGVLGAPLVGVGVPLCVAAFLVGRWYHRGAGWPPRRPEPDRRVAALLAVAVCWVLSCAWLLHRV